MGSEAPHDLGFPPFPEGHRLGTLEIVRPLALQAWARLYVVRHPDHEVPCVARVYRPTGSPESSLPRLREALSRAVPWLTDLGHPSIARVYAIEEHAGYPVLLEEFVEGLNLREFIEARKAVGCVLDSYEITRIARSVTEALAFAHGNGITHGDLGADQIVLGTDRCSRLSGFGQATVLSALGVRGRSPRGDGEKGDASVLPTSPEREPSGRALDLYALGVLMIQMAGGTPPLWDAGFARLAADGAFPQDFPRKLEQFIRTLLDPRRGHGNGDAQAAQKALEDYQFGKRRAGQG